MLEYTHLLTQTGGARFLVLEGAGADGAGAEGAGAVGGGAEGGETSGGASENASFTRVVLAGDTDWAANSTFPLLGNAQLFANSVAYLARELDLVDVMVYEPDVRRLRLTEGGAILYVVFATVGLPGVMLGAAFVLWWGRRRL